MKPTRNLWLWIALEILVAFIAHWLLKELGRGFAGPRAWWNKSEASAFNRSRQPPPDSSGDIRNDYSRN